MKPLIDLIAHQRTFRVEHSVPLAEWLLPVVALELDRVRPDTHGPSARGSQAESVSQPHDR